MIVLEVESLIKKYGKFTAINDISFELTEGKIIGLIGSILEVTKDNKN